MKEQLIELIKDDTSYQENKHNKTDIQLVSYIKARAAKYLRRQDGAIDSETIKGWAIHFFTETDEDLKKEVNFNSSPVEIKEPNKPKETKKEVTKKQPKKDENQLSLEDFGL